MKNEIRGLPKRQLIQDFNDELLGSYSVLAHDNIKDVKLVDWFRQIRATLDSKEFQDQCDVLIRLVAVGEWRRYDDGINTVRYFFSDQKYNQNVVVKYTEEGRLISYTLDPGFPSPIELCVESHLADGRQMTTRMEDLIDYCRNAGHDEGFFVRLGSHAPWIGVWRIGGDDDGFFAIDDWFGQNESFRITSNVYSREKMVECVRGYLRGGLSEFQKCVGNWMSIEYAVNLEKSKKK